MAPAFARRAAWAAEALAVAGCCVLLARGLATIHSDGRVRFVAWTAFLVVALAEVAVLATSFAPTRAAPIYLALLLPGLQLADARLAVLGFAASALLPIAAVYAVDHRPSRWLSTTVVGAAVAASCARLFLRDPFRERRCAPACVTNPYLLSRLPELIRDTELLVGAIVLAWIVGATRRHLARRTTIGNEAASFVMCAVAAAWAVRLLQQPRPAPDDPVERWLLLAFVGAVALAAGLRAVAPIAVGLTRLRLRRFAKSLSTAGDLGEITDKIRAATGDRALEVQLGGDEAVERLDTTTAVVRGGRVVATIRHRRASLGRIDAAVTPAVALALETQLVLQEAHSQLLDLERSRATAVHTADDARRRLERDLHDGAQQRLLIVGMRLAHASADESRPADGSWEAAASLVAEALNELRRIGRGDAAIIAELGLDDAVMSLAGSIDVPLAVTSQRCVSPDHDCWPQQAATAAYRLLMGSVAEARRCGANELAVALCCLGPGNGRTITTLHDGESTSARESDRDRVLAAGGRIVTVTDTIDGTNFSAWLP